MNSLLRRSASIAASSAPRRALAALLSSDPSRLIPSEPFSSCPLHSLLSSPDHGRSVSTPRADLPFASPRKIWGCEQSFSRLYCVKAEEGTMTNQVEKSSSPLNHSAEKQSMFRAVGTDSEGSEDNSLKVTCFSPLEATLTKKRSSVLSIESLKIKRNELSQKVTYALIPVLLLVSKTPLTTSLLIFSVYWQIYGFFKEIFLDYVHHEVTQKWVLIYFKLLLFILVKDTILGFGLV